MTTDHIVIGKVFQGSTVLKELGPEYSSLTIADGAEYPVRPAQDESTGPFAQLIRTVRCLKEETNDYLSSLLPSESNATLDDDCDELGEGEEDDDEDADEDLVNDDSNSNKNMPSTSSNSAQDSKPPKKLRVI